jgi:ribosomal protein L24
MEDSKTAVKADQWIRVLKGFYKGDLGFVTRVEAWGAQVVVVPRLKTPTTQADTSLKRKRTAIKPEPRLFNPVTFTSEFQRQPSLRYDGCYTSRGLVFDHGLLRLNLDLHSISPNSAKISSRILELFKSSSHPAISKSDFPCPEEWIFEVGERVIVSSGKEATIAVVKSTHLKVDLATSEGIEAVSWYNVRKLFSTGDFVSVMSGPLRGTRGWVERIVDDTVSLLEYKEEGNVSRSIDDIKVSFILIPADMLIHWFVLQLYDFHVNWLKLTAVPFLHTSSTCKADDSLSKRDSVPWIGTYVIITKIGSPLKGYVGIVKDVIRGQDTASGLKIAVQMTHLEPSSPFRTAIVDHDDLIEQR